MFVSHYIGNPKDRFSRDEAELLVPVHLCLTEFIYDLFGKHGDPNL